MKPNRLIICLSLALVVVLAADFCLFYLPRRGGWKSEQMVASGVVPHHLVAEELIEDFFSYLAAQAEPEAVVLLSPDHFQAASVVGNAVSAPSSGFITLPPIVQELEGLKVARGLISGLSTDNLVFSSQPAIQLEHGITNLLPFIKRHFPKAKIVPFIIPLSISQKEVEQFTLSLNRLASEKTIIIASVDFSHYLPPFAAQFHDVKSIRTLINFEKESFADLEVDSWHSLYIARYFAKLRHKEFPKVIGQGQSIDFFEEAAAAPEGVTSYFSLVFEERNNQELPEIEEAGAETVLFVGDIMLDRGVEYLMNKNSSFYPFEKIEQFLKGIDIVFGNLEGPIVKEPPYFPDESLKFAFGPETAKTLASAHLNLFSLANNHSGSLMEEGLQETRNFLEEHNIHTLGEPNGCSQDFSFQKGDIIFLSFNTTFHFNCKEEVLANVVRDVRLQNPESFLIVSLHWGAEYQLQSSLQQQSLARKLIDEGADLIVGHHPHVVQEIEEYQGKLIFYSLGNFIFDQYFSKETQQGLAVGLEVRLPSEGVGSEVTYRLFPIQSRLSQPFLMEGKEANGFLEGLAQKSSPKLFNQIKVGIITTEKLK